MARRRWWCWWTPEADAICGSQMELLLPDVSCAWTDTGNAHPPSPLRLPGGTECAVGRRLDRPAPRLLPVSATHPGTAAGAFESGGSALRWEVHRFASHPDSLPLRRPSSSPFCQLITGVCLFFIVIYQAMDAVDGIHARNIRNESIIGEVRPTDRAHLFVPL